MRSILVYCSAFGAILPKGSIFNLNHMFRFASAGYFRQIPHRHEDGKSQKQHDYSNPNR